MGITELLPKHHVAAYNGKLVDIDYVNDAKREFMVACQRVVDNAHAGFVLTPKGKVYSLTRGKGRAAPVVGIEAASVLNRWRWSQDFPANDPPRVRPQSFDNGEKTRQRVLVDGLNCLPGQLDLFD